jgi:hypothetical protein
VALNIHEGITRNAVRILLKDKVKVMYRVMEEREKLATGDGVPFLLFLLSLRHAASHACA